MSIEAIPDSLYVRCLEEMDSAVMIVADDHTVKHANPVAQSFFGFNPVEKNLDEVFKKGQFELMQADQEAETVSLTSRWWQYVEKHRHLHGLCQMCIDTQETKMDFQCVYHKDAEGAAWVAVILTPEHTGDGEDLTHYYMHHDPLTGALNRIGLKLKLHEVIKSSAMKGRTSALLMINLDYFFAVSRSIDYIYIEEMIVEFGTRLSALVDCPDHLCRPSTKEYAIVVPDVSGINIRNLLNKILNVIREPVQLGEHNIHMTASIGVAYYPDHAKNVREWIQNACEAAFDVKARTHDDYQIFIPKKKEEKAKPSNFDIAHELHTALARKEFSLVYQPKVDGKTGKVVGVEALIRWYNEKLGFIAPDLFIKLAEQTGLIVPIGDWVIQEACRQNAEWRKEGHELTISVNLSARQMIKHNIIAVIIKALDDYQLSASSLQIELTESILMNNVEQHLAYLKALKTSGVTLALDDFGTGFSSLSYVNRFPFDVLKIDRAFVKGMHNSEEELGIVKVIIELANVMHMQALAEGVETQEDVDVLMELGCNFFQGYFYSKPLPADEVIGFLKLAEA